MGLVDKFGDALEALAESRAYMAGTAKLRKRLGDEQRFLAALEQAKSLREDLSRPEPIPGDPLVPASFVAEEFLPDGLVCSRRHGFDQLKIQKFFHIRAGGINRWRDPQNGKAPWEIVHEAGQKHGVHPKWILMKLQGEEGALRKAEPTQEDLDWVMNAGVPDRGPRRDDKKGFAVQIDFACQLIRFHFDRFQPGVTVKDVGFKMEPRNAATYANAKYTPHVEGLELLWTVARGFEKFWSA